MKILTYSTYTHIERAKQLCLEHELYIRWWSFQYWLQYYEFQHIVIAHDKGKPVGCLLMTTEEFADDDGLNMGVFVKESHRRQGIGRAMVETLMKKHPKLMFNHGRGIDGSLQFFNKVLGNKGKYCA